MVSRCVGKRRYKQRVSYHVEGLAGGQDYGTFNSDINALEKAVKERILNVSDGKGGFCSPPKPSFNAFLELEDWAIGNFNKLGRAASPLTQEEFLRAYDGRKLTIYRNALDSLKGKPLRKTDSEVKFFMKVEKVNFSKKPNSVPRGISPRDPRYHVTLGPYIKRIEKTIYKDIDRIWGGVTIMKGFNAKQRGETILSHWQSFKNPVAVGIDASRFDQHVSKEALTFEHNVYLKYYVGNHRKRLEHLLRRQLVNKGRGYAQDGKLKFRVKGVRMSGDMNTSLGNCLIMSMMVKKVVDKLGIRCKFVNDGDDGVLFMERTDLTKLTLHLHDLCLNYGFNVILEPPAFKLEDVEFCQCKPIRTSAVDCIMVRDIAASLDKDVMSILPMSKKLAPKWCRSVGDCGLSLTSGLPVLQEFYEALRRQSSTSMKDDGQQTGFKMMAIGMGSPKWNPVSDYARLSYWRAFGVPPDKQLEQESYYRGVVIDHGNISIRKSPKVHLLC